MDEIQRNFVQLLKERDILISDNQLAQFELYYKELIEWNNKLNLTAITEREQVYLKHFYDSLSLAFYYDMNKALSIADIGSGAGFPSIPLRIIFPHLKVTIVDSLNKRIIFLKELVDKLELNNVECIHGRAEDVSRMPAYRDQFDLVTARAVAKLSVLNELCLPFVKKDGHFIAMKGSEIEEELLDAAYSISELKGKVVQVDRMELPSEHSIRHIVVIKKRFATPAKYPRKAGLLNKNPLTKG
ncbi:16S rRNA (guanine(527)-N(7))-methyltransferase RsmG [Paenibacillus eucommiae]|uniref:Ribosomal RNA small subunit methyltransferase G n=1 Tax=Paenibacillus eucommiae TaxID=1355755 RepID=A0ABS4J467_9BACL|nr:16S rRNA (guanine(527)-N(7))-methyltransferase RsmG [Paenibacillus eucommiae]MBP1994603.1 16S rRNA (guanine527-N7)-methyltransferase [Paenibacillus eucommiae]